MNFLPKTELLLRFLKKCTNKGMLIVTYCFLVPVIIRASKVGDLAVIVMPKNIVRVDAFLTLMAPPVLYVLRADVSVELPAEYGAPRPGVPRTQRLSGDVKVLP